MNVSLSTALPSFHNNKSSPPFLATFFLAKQPFFIAAMAPALSTLSSSKDTTDKPANLESTARPVLTKSIIAKKKKNPQKKILEFFSPAGPNKLPSRNFQGFPIKQCIFEPTVNKWVYQPRGWGNYLPFPFTKASWLFCEHCMLKPCFAMRKHCDLFCVEEEKEDMNHNNPCTSFSTMNRELREKALALMAEVFGRGYAQRTGLPKCVLDDIDDRFPTWWDDQAIICQKWEEMEIDSTTDEMVQEVGVL